MTHLARVVIASGKKVLAFDLLAVMAKPIASRCKICIVLRQRMLLRLDCMRISACPVAQGFLCLGGGFGL